jgi:hypothetical protein
MIIIKKNKTYEQPRRINEAGEIPVLRFETLVQAIVSGEFRPNHIEIHSKQARFNVSISGIFTINTQLDLMYFIPKGNASLDVLISIGKSDVIRIHQNSNPKYPHFRIEMKSGVEFYISQV